MEVHLMIDVMSDVPNTEDAENSKAAAGAGWSG
jgi:hypothetical protein